MRPLLTTAQLFAFMCPSGLGSERSADYREDTDIGEHAMLWPAAASITRFVCDFDVDVSGWVPQASRLG